MSEHQVESVALLLVNSAGLLYCVQELQSKPAVGKIVGSKDRSFPWETREPEERIRQTLRRLIKEEIDQTMRVRMGDLVSVGNCEALPGVLAYVYVARFLYGPEEMRGSHAGIEIEPLGWQTREFLLGRCRDGVPEVLAQLARWDRYQ